MILSSLSSSFCLSIMCFLLQVYHFVPSSRLLICTPSNSAADLICIRLHHSGFLDAASLARVNASCRQDEVRLRFADKKFTVQLQTHSTSGQIYSQVKYRWGPEWFAWHPLVRHCCLFFLSPSQKCWDCTQRQEKTFVRHLSTGLLSAPAPALACSIT